MLKQEHFYMEKIYEITTVVGKVYENAIEELYFVGYTRHHKDQEQKIIYTTNIDYDDIEYDITDNNHRLFDTREEAEQFIGFYNNGKEFIKIKGEN